MFSLRWITDSDHSVEFTYRLWRMKSRASKSRGHPVNVYTIFNTVIGISYLWFHSAFHCIVHCVISYVRKAYDIVSKQHFSNFPLSRQSVGSGGASQVKKSRVSLYLNWLNPPLIINVYLLLSFLLNLM